MLGTIRIDQVTFFAKVTQLANDATEISSSLDAFPEYQSDSQAIKKYQEQYNELNQALKDYQDLLVRDIEAIKQVGHKLVQMDQNLWKESR